MSEGIRGVIFDMDGLLFDSERLGVEVILRSGIRQGRPIPREVILATLGMTNTISKPYYREKVPGIDPERLFEDFGLGMRALAEESRIPLKKGARELLERLKERKIPCAVASSSPEDYVRLYLRSQNITDRFDVILGGPKGVRSKPEPDIFLLAAQRLGLEPARCLVLEDSRNGVRAGRAAGMTVCMVPDILPFTEELAPYVDCVAEDLNEVKEKYFG